MKKLISITILIFSIITLPGFLCNEDIHVQTGTVIYVDVEGGFYGIIGDNGKHYNPVILPDEIQKDSLRVSFEYKVRENQNSIYMWGELIEIVKIVAI